MEAITRFFPILLLFWRHLEPIAKSSDLGTTICQLPVAGASLAEPSRAPMTSHDTTPALNKCGTEEYYYTIRVPRVDSYVSYLLPLDTLCYPLKYSVLTLYWA